MQSELTVFEIVFLAIGVSVVIVACIALCIKVIGWILERLNRGKESANY
jgi:hypothetical protein